MVILWTRPAAPPRNQLVRIPYFAGLDSRTIAEIERTVRRRAFAAGEVVLVEGKPCEGLCFVIQGQVRLVRRSAAGREYVLRVLGPGATFNDIAVFDGQHEHIVEQAPDACAHITHQEIASMVGSVREVVQRALKELEREGAIVLERSRIRIRDQSKLEQRAHLRE
jgi:CRP-like cAMP-binding protein